MKKAGALLIGLMTFIFGFGQTGTNVVISQVYGGGGNTGSVYTNDFIELFNPTGSAISLNGWSVQYNSATGTGTWQVTNLTNFTLQPGQYYLVQEAAGTGGTTPLPAPNATGTIAMSGTAGKIALVNSTTALSGCPASGTVVDLVGFGLTANCFEGAGPSTAPSNSNSVIRASNGCTDANNNSADFSSVLAAPRNSSSPFNICGGGPPTITVVGIINDFGTVTLGNFSASQMITVSGANLTPAAGNIQVGATLFMHFSVSLDNVNFFSSVSLPYTGKTLAATPVYVKYSPGATGLHPSVLNINGGGASGPFIPLAGTCIPSPLPTLSASSPSGFPATCINTTSEPDSFNVTGNNLNATNVNVGPATYYTFSASINGPYSAVLSISHIGSFASKLYIKYSPTATGTHFRLVPVAGGGADTVYFSAIGTGVNSAPTAATGSASAITTTSATCAGSISNNGCTAVTEYGIEYSSTNGFTPGSGIKVISTNISGGAFTANLTGLQPSTPYYFRAYATNGGGTGYGTQQSFVSASPVLTATALTAFGNVCVNATAGPNSFTLTGIGLTNANINVGPRGGFSFSTTSGGTYSASLSLTQPGGNYTQTIFVKFSPTTAASYTGSIPVSGGASLPFSVTGTGAGINTPPTVSNGTVSGITPVKVTLEGSITDIGCSAVTAYGAEFSSINGFTNGNGQKVPASNLTGGNFSATIGGLVPNTTYYYTLYAVNSGGITYGTRQSFTTAALPKGFVIYSNPATRGGSIRFTVSDIKPGHYAAQVFNRMGQLVYQKDMIVGVNFIDETLQLPGKLTPGIYTLQVGTIDEVVKKTFVIQ